MCVTERVSSTGPPLYRDTRQPSGEWVRERERERRRKRGVAALSSLQTHLRAQRHSDLTTGPRSWTRLHTLTKNTYCTYAYNHTHTHRYVCKCTNTYTHAHTDTHTHTQTHTTTYTCRQAIAGQHVYVVVCFCVRVCVSVWA